MPRIIRLVVPGLPHHIIQRGKSRKTVFATLEPVGDFAGFHGQSFKVGNLEPLRGSEVIGRPHGSVSFIAELVQRLRRTL